MAAAGERKAMEFIGPGTKLRFQIVQERFRHTVLIPLSDEMWGVEQTCDVWGQAYFGFSVLAALATFAAWFMGFVGAYCLAQAIWLNFFRRTSLNMYHITEDYVWLGGASAAFLDALPPWPFRPE